MLVSPCNSVRYNTVYTLWGETFVGFFGSAAICESFITQIVDQPGSYITIWRNKNAKIVKSSDPRKFTLQS